MMEELVQRLAELQEERGSLKAQADLAVYHRGYDRDITKLRKELDKVKEFEKHVRFAYECGCDELSSEIKKISEQIIDEWDGEKKTMQYPDGTLKFRTTQRLTIENDALVLTGLLDHTSVKDVAENYISGFNKTAVKKYMGVLDLPTGAAEIEYKTTVKLESEG